MLNQLNGAIAKFRKKWPEQRRIMIEAELTRLAPHLGCEAEALMSQVTLWGEGMAEQNVHEFQCLISESSEMTILAVGVALILIDMAIRSGQCNTLDQMRSLIPDYWDAEFSEEECKSYEGHIELIHSMTKQEFTEYLNNSIRHHLTNDWTQEQI